MLLFDGIAAEVVGRLGNYGIKQLQPRDYCGLLDAFAKGENLATGCSNRLGGCGVVSDNQFNIQYSGLLCYPTGLFSKSLIWLPTVCFVLT